jgi:hypothetical protein
MAQVMRAQSLSPNEQPIGLTASLRFDDRTGLNRSAATDRSATPKALMHTRFTALRAAPHALAPTPGRLRAARDRMWLVEDFRADLERVKVGAPTVRKAMMLLQGILRRAVVRGLIASNPAQSVGKPKQPPAQPPQPLAQEVVERIRAHMMTAWSSPSRGSGRSPRAAGVVAGA